MYVIGLMLYFCSSHGQDINVTFSATGAANRIDSVRATNLTTNRFITIPGGETLVLSPNAGIESIADLADEGSVYPNPFDGRTTFHLSIGHPQLISLRVNNLSGQLVTESQVFVQQGDHEFMLSLSQEGIYFVNLSTLQGTRNYKVICRNAWGSENTIRYLGTGSSKGIHHTGSGLKSFQSGYVLGYSLGEIIFYECYGGLHTTILTDSPTASKNYEVVFVNCTDPDGRHYPIVKIGNQTWMAENLAYLPAVSPQTSGSTSSVFYYVYGYQGTSVSEAKEIFNYTTYGVLYNGVAAKTACPAGWRLPSDNDWIVLEKLLGMAESETDILGYRPSGNVGTKLKSTYNWSNRGNGDNSSGFNALPGGFRSTFGFFDSRTSTANFWSSTPYGLNDVSAYNRSLGCNNTGVTRERLTCDWGYSIRCLKN